MPKTNAEIHSGPNGAFCGVREEPSRRDWSREPSILDEPKWKLQSVTIPAIEARFAQIEQATFAPCGEIKVEGM